MDLFIFLLLLVIILICYAHSKANPNAFANFIIGLTLMGIAINLYAEGLSVPNAGVSFTSTTATFLSTTYTMSNPWIMGIFWMFFVMGFVIFSYTIGLLASGRVLNDGSIR